MKAEVMKGTVQGAVPGGARALAQPSLQSQLVSGGAWALTGRLGTTLTQLVVNGLLARLLSPREIGAYFICASLVSLAAVMAQLGLGQAVVRLTAESLGTGRPGRARAALGATLKAGALGTLAVAVLLALGAERWLAQGLFSSPLIAAAVPAVVAWVVVFSFQGLLAESFRGLHDIRLATLFGGLATSALAAVLFAGLWLWRGHSELGQVLRLTVLASAASAAVAGLLLRRRTKQLSGPGTLKAGDLFSLAWPLLVTNLTLFALAQADIWVLGACRPKAEVALYGAAARLVALLVLPLTIVNAVVPPLIASLHAQGRHRELERALRAAGSLAALPALAVLGVFLLEGRAILGLVYGDFYRQGVTVLVLLSLGQLVNVGAGPCGLTLMLTGHQATMMRITVLCGLLALGGSLGLVRSHGALGVAAAVSAGMVLQNLLMLLMARLRVGIWTHLDHPGRALAYLRSGQP